METIYTTQARATGGPLGHVMTNDGILDLETKPPKELGGPGGSTNPEQLFAAAFSTCFKTALSLALHEVGASGFLEPEVTAEVRLGSDPSLGYHFAVTLFVTIPGFDEDGSKGLIERAKELWPFANAKLGSIPIDVKLETTLSSWPM